MGAVGLEGCDGEIFVVVFRQEGRARVGYGGGLGDEGQVGHVGAAKACVPAMVHGRRLGQLEAVLPAAGRRRGPDLVAGVVARRRVPRLVEARPLALAVTAARPAARPPDVV